jgi:hypothetical protein
MLRAAALAEVVGVALAVCSQAANGAAGIRPVKRGGELLLFEASRDELKSIRTYTASWRKGSDLTPVARSVTRDGEPWVEFTFRGRAGMACSTLYSAKAPDPDEGMRYRGIGLVLDCDRDDYPHIGVTVAFTDKTQLSHDLTLEKGTHEYLVESGFRRAKHPPRWELLSYVMLTLDASRHATDLTYRLRRMTLRQAKASAGGAPGSGRVPDLFAEPILSPRPKKVRWQEGTFPARRAWPLYLEGAATERTRRTAKLFADRYYGCTGRRLVVQTFDGALPEAGIVLRVARAAPGPPKQAQLKPQGYTLAVAKDRVAVTGADEPGLFYGTVTFFQLLKGALKKPTDSPAVPCVEVLDWPDTPNRLIRLEHPHTFRNYAVRENRGIDYLIDWTDRFIVGNKINVLFIDLAANVRYERRSEFNGTERVYSLADLRRFGDFCRDHFVELCPAWQVGGHANWWLTIGYHPELREKGWASQGDVTHPEHDAVVRACMLDVIEALRPKYLSPKSDEWWARRKEGETPDPLLRGRSRAEAFLNFHVRLDAWLKARGITMMIFPDMLSPYHNGKRFDLYKVIDRFPKDIILMPWSGGTVEKDIRYFTDRGFGVWPNATGMFALSDEAKARVMGFGKGIYSFGNDRAHLLDEYSPLWSMSNVIRVADYAWNFARDERPDPGRLVAVEHLLALRPNPHAGARVVPIDLAPALTHSLNAFLKEVKPDAYARRPRPVKLSAGVREIGFLPMRLAGGRGNDCIVLRKNSAPVVLPVRGRFASLIFLHSAFINDPHDKAVAGVRVREWMYGWPCGRYVVQYADGSRAVLPVRLTANVKRLDTASASRAALDSRYTWAVEDANGKPVHLHQWEWVNPKPDEEIVRVVAEHDHVLDVSLLLSAVSGRNASGTESKPTPAGKTQ